MRYKTDLEHLLSIFDQHFITNDQHILNVKEDSFPQKHRHIIRKLQQAVAEPEVRKTMDIEDEILEELQDKERHIARVEKEKEIALIQLTEKDSELAEKYSELADKDNALADKDSALAEKDSELAEKDNALSEKEKELAEKDKVVVINAHQSGLDIKTIEKITQLSSDKIEKIIIAL